MNMKVINNVIYSTLPNYGRNTKKVVLKAKPLISNLDELWMWTPGYPEPRRMKTKGGSLVFDLNDVMEAFDVLYPATRNWKVDEQLIKPVIDEQPIIKEQVIVKPEVSKIEGLTGADKVAEMLLNNPNASVAILEKVLSITTNPLLIERVMSHPMCSEDMALRAADILLTPQTIIETVEPVSEIKQEPIIETVEQAIQTEQAIEPINEGEFIITPIKRPVNNIKPSNIKSVGVGSSIKGR